MANARITAAAEPTAAPTAARNAYEGWREGDAVPRFGTLETAAYIVTGRFFPVSPRTLERWPLKSGRIVNKRTVCEIAEVLAIAEDMVQAAPCLASGNR